MTDEHIPALLVLRSFKCATKFLVVCSNTVQKCEKHYLLSWAQIVFWCVMIQHQRWMLSRSQRVVWERC